MRKSETTLATRSTRLRRQSSKLPGRAESDRLPGLMEEIEVLWSVGKGKMWWKAEVIEINTPYTSPQRAASGTIRYVQHKDYSPEDFGVTFVRPSTGAKLLRHTYPSSPNLVTWKFPEEEVKIMEELSVPEKAQRQEEPISRKEEPIIPGARSPISKQRNKGQDQNHVDSQLSSTPHQVNTITERAPNTLKIEQSALQTPTTTTKDEDEMYVIDGPFSAIRFLNQHKTLLTL